MVSRLFRAFVIAGIVASALGFVNQSEAGREPVSVVISQR